MIIGIGSDMLDIRRFEKVMAKFETRFLERSFTPIERAKRFAAKEAMSKALGTGFNQGVYMKDIGVINAPSGAPTLELTGGAHERLEAMTPEGHTAIIHLTLTDEPPYAQAQVIIEAIPIST